jgi:hypothetical protein
MFFLALLSISFCGLGNHIRKMAFEFMVMVVAVCVRSSAQRLKNNEHVIGLLSIIICFL